MKISCSLLVTTQPVLVICSFCGIGVRLGGDVSPQHFAKGHFAPITYKSNMYKPTNPVNFSITENSDAPECKIGMQKLQRDAADVHEAKKKKLCCCCRFASVLRVSTVPFCSDNTSGELKTLKYITII